MSLLKPKPPGPWDGFYFHHWLYKKVQDVEKLKIEEEQRRWREHLEPYPYTRFAKIRKAVPFVFNVTDLFCDLVAAYKAFVLPPLPMDAKTLLRLKAGWSIQAMLEQEWATLTFFGYDRGGLQDWKHGIVGIPDSIFKNHISEELAAIDIKTRSLWAYRQLKRKSVTVDFRPTYFYPPFPRDEMQMLIYLNMLRNAGIRQYEQQSDDQQIPEPIRIGIIINVDLNSFEMKESVVVYDQVRAQQMLAQVDELREKLIWVQEKTQGEHQEVMRLLPTCVEGLPLEDDVHAYCPFRNICPIGQEYDARIGQSGRPKLPLHILRKINKRRARADMTGVPTVMPDRPQQQLFPEGDPGLLKASTPREGRGIRASGKAPTPESPD